MRQETVCSPKLWGCPCEYIIEAIREALDHYKTDRRTLSTDEIVNIATKRQREDAEAAAAAAAAEEASAAAAAAAKAAVEASAAAAAAAKAAEEASAAAAEEEQAVPGAASSSNAAQSASQPEPEPDATTQPAGSGGGADQLGPRTRPAPGAMTEGGDGAEDEELSEMKGLLKAEKKKAPKATARLLKNANDRIAALEQAAEAAAAQLAEERVSAMRAMRELKAQLKAAEAQTADAAKRATAAEVRAARASDMCARAAEEGAAAALQPFVMSNAHYLATPKQFDAMLFNVAKTGTLALRLPDGATCSASARFVGGAVVVTVGADGGAPPADAAVSIADNVAGTTSCDLVLPVGEACSVLAAMCALLAAVPKRVPMMASFKSPYRAISEVLAWVDPSSASSVGEKRKHR